jgi:predicted lipoprotein
MARLAVLLLSSSALFASCHRVGTRTNPSSDASTSYPLPDGGQLTRAAVLNAFGQCALSGYREFAALSADLETQAQKAESDSSARSVAREMWKSTIDQWQKLEVFQFGPSAMSSFPGGKDLREHIYPWPLGSRCLIEQTIVSGAYAQPGFESGLIAMRGLWVNEYLLFYDGNDHTCGAQSTTETQWIALGDQEISKRKASYAFVTAKDVHARALELVTAWDPAQGNFLAELVTAGHGSKTFATDQLAFNAVSDALFYLDYATKDLKIGKPAGIQDCLTPTCLEFLESQFAHRSKRHIRNNLLGFRMLLTGCGADASGLGWGDVLVALGRADLAMDLEKDTLAAIAAVDAIAQADLDTAITQDLARVRALYDAVKRITDRLKSEFVTVLDLELPKRVESDND